jgi:hypothetical protein
MARELQLVTWCDGDHETDVRATVVRTLSVDGGKPVLLDLCEPCDKAVQDVLVLMDAGVYADKALVAPGSRPPRAVRAVPDAQPEPSKSQRADGRDRTDCVEDGCGYVAPTRSALGQHVKQKHETKLSNYDWTLE